jgi:hypothetical protein
MIAKPVTKLLEKDAKYKWSRHYEEAFLTLKKLPTTAPMLAQPNIEKLFDVYCDASGTGIGMLSPMLQTNSDVMKSTIQLRI